MTMTLSETIIDKYTRAEALADGGCYNLSDRFPELVASLGYRIPVYCSRDVWFDLIDGPARHNDADQPNHQASALLLLGDLVSDLRRNQGQSELTHRLALPQGSERQPDQTISTRRSIIHVCRIVVSIEAIDFDNLNPCINVCFPEEV